jgi:hypothetical protein
MLYIFLLLLGYILYRFIFGFVLPVYRTTQKVKKQFGDLQQKAREQFQNATNFNQTPQADIPKPQKGGKDYIDFEEVK